MLGKPQHTIHRQPIPDSQGAEEVNRLERALVQTRHEILDVQRKVSAAMGAKEKTQILDLIGNLKGRNEVSIIIIAHNYAQVLEVADRINLLRQGAITLDKPTSETSLKELTDVVVEEYRRSRRSA